MNQPKYQIGDEAPPPLRDRDLEIDFTICDICYCSNELENMMYEQDTGAVVCPQCFDRRYFSDEEDE